MDHLRPYGTARPEAGAGHLIASLEPTTSETVAEFAEALRLFRSET
jgi:hypothetical protein